MTRQPSHSTSEVVKPNSGRRLGIFAKYWEPGQVKTRLAKHIGDQLAADLHRAFIELLTNELAGIQANRQLVFSPLQSHAKWKSVKELEGWDFVPQSEGNLGDRLDRYFIDALNQGSQSVVVIGADSPWLDTKRIHEAFEQLLNFDCVLGPAEDGGYYLIGFRKYVPGMLDAIEWSTCDTLTHTRASIVRHGLQCAELELGTDVDTFEDLAKFADWIRSRSALSSHSTDHAMERFSKVSRLMESVLGLASPLHPPGLTP